MDWDDLAAVPLTRSHGGSTSTTITAENLEKASTTGSKVWNDYSLPIWNSSSTAVHHQQQQPLDYSMSTLLQNHERVLMERITRNASAAVQQRTDELIERQLQRIAGQDRAAWGGRPLVADKTGTNTNSSLPLLENQQQESVSGALLLTNDSVNNSTTNPPPTLPAPTTSWMTAKRQAAKNAQPLDPQLVTEHLEVLVHMKEHLLKAASDFSKLRCCPTSNARQALAPMDAGYQAAWQLTCSLVSSQISSKTPVEKARATLSHLSRQFQALVRNQTRSHVVEEQEQPFQTEWAQQCAAFVKVTLLNVSNSTNSQNHWPTLFYCLRCGSAIAALEVYDKCITKMTAQTNPAVRTILALLATAQQEADTDTCWTSPLAALDYEQQTLLNLYEIATGNIHEQAVYALLAGERLPDSSVVGMSALEDHVTAALWKALLQQQDDPTAVSTVISKMGSKLLSLGPDYFGSSEGWAYAQPLLLTQQYHTAFRHLSATSAVGVLQATHLAYVLHLGGVALEDLGSEAPKDQSKDPSSLLTSLLLTYAQNLVGIASAGGPRAAIEYLLRIPDERRARHEVAQLIANTSGNGNLESLVGTISVDGVRVPPPNSVLEQYWTPLQIQCMLGEAAGFLLSSHSSNSNIARGQALMCYLLAGRYADLLRVLNQSMCPPHDTTKTTFWVQQWSDLARSFLTTNSHILQVLQRQNQSSLIATGQVLVQLHHFFTLARSNNNDSAWHVVDQELRWIPTRHEDIASMVNTYEHHLDPLLQQSYPAVLVAALELLCRRLRSFQQQHQDHQSDDRLQHIRQRARLIVVLAGYMKEHTSAEQMERMSRLEAGLL